MQMTSPQTRGGQRKQRAHVDQAIKVAKAAVEALKAEHNVSYSLKQQGSRSVFTIELDSLTAVHTVGPAFKKGLEAGFHEARLLRPSSDVLCIRYAERKENKLPKVAN